MALIKCPNCNKEISDTINTCIHCNYVLKKEIEEQPELINTDVEKPKENIDSGKIIIHSYNETFVVNPAVKIYQNNQYITKISKDETIVLPVENDSIFTFKSSTREKTIQVFKNNKTEVKLSMNRITGALEAIVNIQTDDVEANKINQKSYDNTINKKMRNNKIILFISLGIIIMFFGRVLYRYISYSKLQDSKNEINENYDTINQIKPETLRDGEVEYIYEIKNSYTLPSGLKPGAYMDMYFNGNFDDEYVMTGKFIKNIRVLDVRDKDNNILDTTTSNERPVVIKLAVTEEILILLMKANLLDKKYDINMQLVNSFSYTEEDDKKIEIVSEDIRVFIDSKSVAVY